MEDTVVNMANTGPEVYELSIMSLFWQADWIVKTVMLSLLVASVWCWAIIIEKTIRISKVSRRAAKFEEAFWSGGSLDDLYDRIGKFPTDPMSSIFAAAMKEWRHASSRGLSNGGVNLHERIDRVMQVTLSREIGQLERYLTFLATVGSSATFVGLFGTVWGIMNSFTSIAASKQTSLAVVAPGIAEALFATALGLIAAIPATVAYNKISSDLGKLGSRLDGFSGEFSAIISRQLDEGK